MMKDSFNLISVREPMTKQRTKPYYYLIFALTGFTATGSQIVFVREFFSLFSGNELFLGAYFAAWLFWTGLGSFLAGRLWPDKTGADLRVAWLQIALAVSVPLTLVTIRLSFILGHPVIGMEPGFFKTLIDLFIVLGPFCVFSGALFSAGNQFLQTKKNISPAISAGNVYVAETAASALGGLILALFIIAFVPVQITVFLLSLLNLISAGLLFRPSKKRAIIPLFLLLLIAASGGFWGAFYSPYKAFRTLEVVDSKYGRMVVLQQSENTFVIENGRMAFSRLDQQHAESIVHPAMLTAREPENVLMIGGAFSGSILEVLKYASVQRLDYVELDPAILRIGQHYFPNIWHKINADRRVRIHHTDGRRFLARTRQKYDVVIIDLPDPRTAQLNRFYTAEFFRLISKRLSPEGVFSFSLSGSENYLNPPMARFIACEWRSLTSAFREIRFIPGDVIYFFASNHGFASRFNAAWLVSALQKKKIHADYVGPAYLPFRLMPERIEDFQQTIQAVPSVPLNRDLHPQAYYFNLALQGAKYSQSLLLFFNRLYQTPFFSLLAAIVFVYLFVLLWGRYASKKYSLTRFFGALSVFNMGFSSMATYLVVLLLYQTYFGSLYFQITLLTGAYMLGMTGGSWGALFFNLKGKEPPLLTALHFFAAGLPFVLLKTVSLLPSGALVFCAALLSGAVAGAVFPIAGRLYYAADVPEQNSGGLYGLDLFGAVGSSLLVTTVLIPIYGFYRTAVIIGVVNVVTMVAGGLLRIKLFQN